MSKISSIKIFEEDNDVSNVKDDGNIVPTLGKSVWKEAGRGRKKCGGCQLYIGVRSSKCPDCGFIFSKRVEADSAINSDGLDNEDTLSLKKQSSADKKKKVVDNKESEPTLDKSDFGRKKYRVLIPAGYPPVKLSSSNDSDVEEWVKAVCAAGEEKYQIFTPDAMQYYARYYFDTFGEEYQKICSIINRVMGVEQPLDANDSLQNESDISGDLNADIPSVS